MPKYRALIPVLAGAAGGALLTYYFVRHDAMERPAAAREASAPDAAVLRPAAATPSRSATAERADTYRVAAGADAAALERLIAAAAARPASPQRDFELGVLLTRFVEIDAERAVELARDNEASTPLLASLYATWARGDPAAALASLAGIDDAVLATEAGLAMLTVLGSDDYAMSRILGALPPRAERSFRVAALASLAATSPEDAFARSLAIDDAGLRMVALERVAGAWARMNPRAALARAEEIDDQELQLTLQSSVLREWARLDADGLFDHFATLDRSDQQRFAGIGMFELARIDPNRMMELAGTLPPGIGENMRQTAIGVIAQNDPLAALRYLGQFAPGRQQLLRQTVARSYGQKDADAALEWARASGEPTDLPNVLAGIARNDPNRALDMALDLPGALERANAVQAVLNGLGNGRDLDAEAIADRLVVLADEPVRNAGIARLMQTWSQREPERALGWLIANAQRAPAAAFQNVARALGATDPAAAARHVAQVPAEMRPQWLQSAAQSYAQTDARGAVAWVAQYRGQPGHAEATAAVAQQLARMDAPAAAELLDSVATTLLGTGTFVPAARAVARGWAQSQPLAAAAWALQLPSGQARTAALTDTAAVWASKDYAAARGWTMQLAAGEARDAALGALLARSGAEQLDSALIAEMSTPATRERAVLNAMRAVAVRNPAEARTLIDRYLTSPAQREQAERILEQARNAAASPLFVPTL